MNRLAKYLLAFSVLAVSAHSQTRPPSTPAQSIRANFDDINRKLLEMAQDFPADKYSYSPAKDVRSFGAALVHIASGNAFGAKAGRGEKVNWDEIDPKSYTTKAAVVALLQKSITDASATLKATPDDRFTKTLSPWVGIIEHDGEHYGQLVIYYRLNGLVPPESRPKPKS